MLVAGMPSPEYPAIPFPAIEVIILQDVADDAVTVTTFVAVELPQALVTV